MSDPIYKPTFYTVFSNSSNPDEFLPNLSDEATKISDLLHRLVFLNKIYYMKDEIFSVDRLITNFTKYGDKYTHFYFSGHAKDGALKFSDNFMPDSTRMAELMNGTLPKLELAFFNACETYPLAKKLVELREQKQQDVPLVIISCGREVNAYRAENFATLFFNHIGRPGTYLDAYRNAAFAISMKDTKAQCKEFRTPGEALAADGNFDYAIIDFSPVEEKPAARNRSVIDVDKRTTDFLNSNYVKSIRETNLTAKQSAILQEALHQTRLVVEGAAINNKVREIWKTAAEIIPGLDPKNDFKSLVNVSKGEYDKTLDQIFGNTGEKPTIANILSVEEHVH